MPGSRAPTCVRPAVATSRPVPQGKLDTVPHTQLVVDGSKTVLEDVLGGSNFTNDVPVSEALGDEGDDALFPFSWAALPVKIMSEHRAPVHKGGEFDSLDATGNAKAQKPAIEIGLDCPLGNPQLPGNLSVVASFQ